jgi:hypothetical protein
MLILIGLALATVVAMLLAFFFQLNRLEQNLDRTVEIVEVYLLNQYGEIRPDQAVQEEELQEV